MDGSLIQTKITVSVQVGDTVISKEYACMADSIEFTLRVAKEELVKELSTVYPQS